MGNLDSVLLKLPICAVMDIIFIIQKQMFFQE